MERTHTPLTVELIADIIIDHVTVSIVDAPTKRPVLEIGGEQEAARAILARLPAPEGEGWRPIASAPRDGSHILLAFGQDTVAEGSAWAEAQEEADLDNYPAPLTGGGGELIQLPHRETRQYSYALGAAHNTLEIWGVSTTEQNVSRALDAAFAILRNAQALQKEELVEAAKRALAALQGAAGTALGVAMSGNEHPAPDLALMGTYTACSEASADLATAIRAAQDGGSGR